MGNISKFKVFLHMFMSLALLSFVACDKVSDDIVSEENLVNIMLDIDQLTLESASIRVRHDGNSDLDWVYMNTQDLETDAAELIAAKVARELELTGEIVANRGRNRSLTISSLAPKSHYRFICSAIDQQSGMPVGNVAQIEYRTRRDSDVFESNANWSITKGERTYDSKDGIEYDNFNCNSNDDATYVVVTLKDSDFNSYYNGKIRALFEDYQSSFGIEEGSSKWSSVVSQGDIKWQEPRLRSGDWHLFMIGLDPDGELSGLYQSYEFKVEPEVATEEYNRWLGSWKVANLSGTEYFDITIIPSENNMWYYMAGWESTNIYAFDTYDPALMPELFFDKMTGKLCFVSQYVNTMVNGSETVDFYFSGTFTYGQTYVLGQEVLNFRMAQTSFVNADYTEARVEALNFVNSGMEFPIESICYLYYNGSTPGAISMLTPTLPLKLTRIN
jgi:hypothetical protein